MTLNRCHTYRVKFIGPYFKYCKKELCPWSHKLLLLTPSTATGIYVLCVCVFFKHDFISTFPFLLYCDKQKTKFWHFISRWISDARTSSCSEYRQIWGVDKVRGRGRWGARGGGERGKGEGRQTGINRMEGKRGKFCAREARTTPRRVREEGDKEGEVMGRKGRGGRPSPCPPLCYLLKVLFLYQKWPRVGAWTSKLKNPTKCLWRGPTSCSVRLHIYIAEISLNVTLSNHSTPLHCQNEIFLIKYKYMELCPFFRRVTKRKDKGFAYKLSKIP